MIISDKQHRDSAIHIHVSTLPQTPLPPRLPHNIEQSSLCYTVGPCRLPILSTAVSTCPWHFIIDNNHAHCIAQIVTSKGQIKKASGGSGLYLPMVLLAAGSQALGTYNGYPVFDSLESPLKNKILRASCHPACTHWHQHILYLSVLLFRHKNVRWHCDRCYWSQLNWI